MGIKYLWDTNIVIYFLQQQFPKSAGNFIDDTLTESQPAFSVISEIELLCWKTASKKDLATLHAFIDDAWIFELERDIKLKTADIRKAYNIKLPDAIIAATVMVYDLSLITRNIKDFKKIKELNLIDPYNR